MLTREDRQALIEDSVHKEYKKGDQIVKFYQKDIFYANQGFLEMFSFEMIKGNPQKALVEPNTAIITESEAKKYFGDEDPMG